ncbi:MAG: biopolymer transporter ExbD [Phycisphaerae bacterium]|nr:biopolymer transporter ExbD [Phycisphaerae bacterium]
MLNLKNQFNPPTFNITPIIDIVFLLMIFFVVVSRFIETNNLDIKTPDLCDFAENKKDAHPASTVLSITSSPTDDVSFFIDSQKIQADSPQNLQPLLTSKINEKIQTSSNKDGVIIFRADQNALYEDIELGLLALSKSNAKKIKLAVQKQKHSE